MCGIAGIFNLDGRPASPIILRKMADSIRHRGPDGEGFFTQGPIGLAHRRLAILDLSPSGHQPMQSKDGRYTITYNGEVYNFRDLRIELESLGRTFNSNTDSEVVLKAYAEWGPRAVERFNGMFAFAIWDRQDQTLFFARDRYGIKPLYYVKNGSSLVFASEIKALFENPGLDKSLDTSALIEYMTFQNFFSDRTLWSRVKILPAGSTWLVSSSSDSSPQKYWDFQFQEPSAKKTDAEYLEELDHLFTQAVQRQLVSDVEVGSYLSSGMDSGFITAIAAKQVPYMKTFTVGFDLHSASGIELNFDEREKAEYMSYLFKTEHYEMVLKAGDMVRALPEMAWHLEEPRVGQSYPNFYASQLASKFCKVVLAGTGGDELFGGYPWRYYRAVINSSFDHYIDKYFSFWQRLLTSDELAKVFAPISSTVKEVCLKEIFRSVFQEHASELTRPEDFVNHSLYFEAKTFLHGLFVVDDKLSMAHSLETRVPFLDNDLVDFAMRLPVRLKLGKLREIIRINENDPSNKVSRYYEKTRDGKLILRKAFSAYVPEKISKQIKQGFSAPDASWFKGESIEYVRETLLDGNSPIFGLMDPAAVRSLINDHLEGRQNRRLLIWSLLSLHHCFQRYSMEIPRAVGASA